MMFHQLMQLAGRSLSNASYTRSRIAYFSTAFAVELYPPKHGFLNQFYVLGHCLL